MISLIKGGTRIVLRRNVPEIDGGVKPPRYRQQRSGVHHERMILLDTIIYTYVQYSSVVQHKAVKSLCGKGEERGIILNQSANAFGCWLLSHVLLCSGDPLTTSVHCRRDISTKTY